MKTEEKKALLIGSVILGVVLLIYLYKKYKANQTVNNVRTPTTTQSYPNPNGYIQPNGFPYNYYGGQNLYNLMNVASPKTYDISLNGPSPYNFLSQDYMPLFGFVGVYGGKL